MTDVNDSGLVTGVTFPTELLLMLRKMGMPDHVTSFKLECLGAMEFVTLECTFIAHEQSDTAAQDINYMFNDTKRYRLVEVTE